jgi:hypothetical protein
VLSCLVVFLAEPSRAQTIEEDVQFFIEIDCDLNPEVNARAAKVVEQGEKLYPAIRMKLEVTRDDYSISRLVSLMLNAPGDRSKLLPDIRALFNSELAEEDPDIKARAIEALGEMGNEEDAPAILELLQHEDDRVRYYAARALERIGTLEHAEQLQKVLNSYAARKTAEELRRDYFFIRGNQSIAAIREQALVKPMQ